MPLLLLLAQGTGQGEDPRGVIEIQNPEGDFRRDPHNTTYHVVYEYVPSDDRLNPTQV